MVSSRPPTLPLGECCSFEPKRFWHWGLRALGFRLCRLTEAVLRDVPNFKHGIFCFRILYMCNIFCKQHKPRMDASEYSNYLQKL